MGQPLAVRLCTTFPGRTPARGGGSGGGGGHGIARAPGQNRTTNRNKKRLCASADRSEWAGVLCGCLNAWTAAGGTRVSGGAWGRGKVVSYTGVAPKSLLTLTIFSNSVLFWGLIRGHALWDYHAPPPPDDPMTGKHCGTRPPTWIGYLLCGGVVSAGTFSRFPKTVDTQHFPQKTGKTTADQ